MNRYTLQIDKFRFDMLVTVSWWIMKFVSIMFTAEWPRSPLSGVQSHPIVAHTNLDGFCTLDVFGGRFDQQRFDCGILLLHDRPLMGLAGLDVKG